MSKRALGKGLGAIFGEDVGKVLPEKRQSAKEENSTKKEEYVKLSFDENKGESPDTKYEDRASEGLVSIVRLSMVEPNRKQPRKNFDEEALNELASSMKKYGVLQPLIVKKKDDYYEIIAGERRWRAAKLAGLKELPVVIKEIEDVEAAEIALIENIQREDLSPVEEAKAYKRLTEEFGLTQEELAERVSKSRSAITNSMRLLNLDERVLALLEEGKLTGGHARTLIPVADRDEQYRLALYIVENELSVRETEKLLKRETGDRKKEKAKKPQSDIKLYLDNIAEKLTEELGTKVKIVQGSGERGKINIEYYSSEDLERITDILRRR